MKSVNVVFFRSILPWSYHGRPISWPPRICAIAKTYPRSTSGSTPALNSGSELAPYEP